MADVKKSLSALQALFADNLIGNISAQDLRDFLVSVYGNVYSVTVASSTYSVQDNDVLIELNAASNNIAVTLPTGTAYDDRMLLFKRSDVTANTVTITRGGTDTIEGGTSIALTYQYAGLILVKKGTVWLKVAIDGAVFDKIVDTLDNVNDGSSYGKVLLTELSSSQVARIRAVIATQNVTGDAIYNFIQNQQAVYSDSKEPTGFVNRTDSTISFVNGTRTFTIAPAVSSFVYWIKGVKYTKSSPENKIISTTAGLHFVYYDGTVLSETTTFSQSLLTDYALVALVYWTGTKSIIIGDERHGMTMDGETHVYLHTTRGSVVGNNGFGLSGYTLDVVSNAAITVGVSNGILRDEDLSLAISNGTPANQYEQTLVDPAQLPVVYRSGTAGIWTEDTPTDYPYKTAGTGRVAYNFYNGGTGAWEQAEVPNNGFVSYYIVATNDVNYPIKSFQGQIIYVTKADAIAGVATELLSFGDFPSAEVKLLYRIVLETKNSYADAIKSRIVDVADLRYSTPIPSGNVSAAVSHATLADLSYTSAGHTGFGRLPYATTTDPTVNNDGVDTAGIGRVFRIGDQWVNTSTNIFWMCVNNSTGAAVWVLGKASQVIPSVTNFNQILTAADNTVQKALDTIDDFGYSEYYESETLFSTTSGTYVQAKTFTTASLIAGNYLITCMIKAGVNDKDKDGWYRFQLDNTTNIIESSLGRTANAPLSITSTAFRRVALSAGTHLIDLDVYTNNTINVQSTRVFIRRVK